MQLFTIACGLAPLLSFALAAPTEIGALEGRAASCVSSYPAERTDTGAKRTQSLFLRLFANTPELNNRNIGLRPSSDGVSLAVIDSTSPILAYQLRNGTIYSQDSDVTPAQNLGPVGGLRPVSSKSDGTSSQAFIFRNNTDDAGKAFKASVDKWQLTSFGEGEYGLYVSDVATGVTNGFVACKVQDYYQMFYYEYKKDPPKMPGCESVGVQTVVAPVLPVQ